MKCSVRGSRRCGDKRDRECVTEDVELKEEMQEREGGLVRGETVVWFPRRGDELPQ